MTKYAGVVVEAPLTTIYHYAVPEALRGAVATGSRVTVPFGRGNRLTRAVCVEVSETCPVESKRIKELVRVGDEEERIPGDILELTRLLASYYCSSWGTMLATAVPAAVRNERAARTEAWLELALTPGEARQQAETCLGKKQAELLRWLAERVEQAKKDAPAAWLRTEVEAQAGVSAVVIKAAAEKGWITIRHCAPQSPDEEYFEAAKTIALTPTQKATVGTVNQALDARAFSPFLLYGVTGSGKTEVYLQALEHVLAQGRTALVLVPEISLTPQTVARFKARAGDVAVLHSHLSDGERAEAWRRLRRGEARVVVGARSAVFAPLADVGLIIVDEEHERTFKQETDPRYHARDAAVMRAKLCGAAVVLGSATPSLESWANVGKRKYELLSLPERVGGARLPQTAVVDLRAEWAEAKRQVMISRQLEVALIETLSRKEQAILFLNRRGYNTFVQCQSCGSVLECDQCDIALTHHRSEDVVRCHYCDYQTRTPQECPTCRARALRFTGTGTERIEDILMKLLPDVRLLRMDSDTMSRRGAHARALSAFARGEYDILLGTQMVTKGFDFPNVTLVGVLAADTALNLPDFRAAERTFQLVTQVVGRAGRAAKAGHAIIQAYQPDHYAIQFALRQDMQAFAERDLADRQPLGYPPFGKIGRLLVRGKEAARVSQAAAALSDACRGAAPRPLSVLGPSPCAVKRIHGETRMHLLVKGKTIAEVQRMIAAARSGVDLPRSVKMAIDIDPLSLL